MGLVIQKGKAFQSLKKIAIDVPHGLGDQVMCFPLFYSLKSKFPDINITVITSNKNSSLLLLHNKYIDKVKTYSVQFSVFGAMVFFAKEFWKLRSYFKKENFDLFIVIHINMFRNIMAKFLPWKALLVNMEQTHKSKEVKNILDGLSINIGYNYELDGIENNFLSIKDLAGKKYIVLDLYAQHLEKDPRQWPHFAELISMLQKENYLVVVCGVNRRHHVMNGVIDLVNKTNLDELLSVIKGASLVVAMDTGLFHFAYSLRVPVIGLFGPVDPEDRVPFDKKLIVKTIYKNMNCAPCIKNKVMIKCTHRSIKEACMKSITAEEVFREIKNIFIPN